MDPLRDRRDVVRQIHPVAVRQTRAVPRIRDDCPERRQVRQGLRIRCVSDASDAVRQETVREHLVCAAGSFPALLQVSGRKSACRAEGLLLVEWARLLRLRQQPGAPCTPDAGRSAASPHDAVPEQQVLEAALALSSLARSERSQRQQRARRMLPSQVRLEEPALAVLQRMQWMPRFQVSPALNARERQEQPQGAWARPQRPASSLRALALSSRALLSPVQLAVPPLGVSPRSAEEPR